MWLHYSCLFPNKMTFQKYVYRAYSKEYPKLFRVEKMKLRKVLPKNVKIEHVGSSSIPGLGGKGILDIAIRTPKNMINRFTKELVKLGYEYNPAHPRNNVDIFLQRRIKYRGKERRVHVHLALTDTYWNSYIVFRDYLKKNEKERKKYAKIKKEAVKLKHEGEKYRKHKESFIERVMRDALRDLEIK